MTDSDIIINTLKAELTDARTCPVLTGHILRVFQDMDLGQAQGNIENLPSLILEYFPKRKSLGLYNPLENSFRETHKISSKFQNKIIETLDVYSIAYCVYSTFQFTSPDLSDELQKLKKITSISQKLRDVLPKPDSALFQLIKSADNIENLDLESKNVDYFFEQLNAALLTLEKLHEIFPSTALGQLTKIGSKSPNGNTALRIWIIGLHDIWTGILNRNFVYDGTNGQNGAARFTNFAFEALLPLHEAIEHSQVEYAVRAFRELPENAHELLKPKNALSSS